MTLPRLRVPWSPADDARAFVVVLTAALVVRLVGLLGTGHGGDVKAFEEWAEGLAQHGLGGYYAAGGDANYPAMLYLLWPLGVAFDGAPLWAAIRVLSIPFDLALGAVLFAVGRRLAGAGGGPVAAALYLLNPAVVLSGPAWGQVDGMGALPMVVSIVTAASGGLVAAGALAALAGLVKPQFGVAAMVLVGLVAGWLRTADGIGRAAIVALAALLTGAIVLLPLGLDPLGYRAIIADTFGRYPYASHYGFNPWGLLFGFETVDGPWLYVGTTATVLAIGGSLLLLRRRRDLVGLFAVASLVALALYFVPTRVHERYLYGAIPLLAPLAVLVPSLRGPFIALSTMFFVTLWYVVATSPYLILPLPSFLAKDLPWWGVRALCAAMTLAGGWTAWRTLALFRQPEEHRATG